MLVACNMTWCDMPLFVLWLTLCFLLATLEPIYWHSTMLEPTDTVDGKNMSVDHTAGVMLGTVVKWWEVEFSNFRCGLVAPGRWRTENCCDAIRRSVWAKQQSNMCTWGYMGFLGKKRTNAISWWNDRPPGFAVIAELSVTSADLRSRRVGEGMIWALCHTNHGSEIQI